MIDHTDLNVVVFRNASPSTSNDPYHVRIIHIPTGAVVQAADPVQSTAYAKALTGLRRRLEADQP